jgi:hypothetical protein
MAIAFDAKTDGNGTGTSITYSHTCTSATVLWVGCNVDESTTSDVITGVTYNGVSMTLVNKVADSLGYYVYLFRLFNPTAGSNSVVVSRSTSGAIASTAVSWRGTSTTVLDNSATGTAASSTVTMSLTTVASNCWVIAAATKHRGWTAGSNTTLRTAEGVVNMSVADSNGLAGGSGTPGSKSLVATQSDGTASGWVIASIGETDTTVTMVAASGSFVLTGYAATFGTIVGTMIASVGSFILTGYDAVLRYTGWSNQSKNTSSFTNNSKNSSSWTNQTKN